MYTHKDVQYAATLPFFTIPFSERSVVLLALDLVD